MNKKDVRKYTIILLVMTLVTVVVIIVVQLWAYNKISASTKELYDYSATMKMTELSEIIAYVDSQISAGIVWRTQIVTITLGVYILGVIILFSMICQKGLKKYTDIEKTVGSLSTMAYKDQLTGANNRRVANEYMSQYFTMFKTDFKQIAIVMCDIDFFKKINDTYGHDTGDKVLIRVARILEASVRGNDKVCRWGGEEFLLVMPGANEELASHVMEKARKAIEKEIMVDEEARQFSTSMSFGVAQFMSLDNSYDDAVSRADKAMYYSKENGRNRVTVHSLMGT